MPNKSIPTLGDSNWGRPLNNHLSQLQNPFTGGINSFNQFSQRTSLGVDDTGKTSVNSQTGNIHQWSGAAWDILNTSVINVKDYGVVGDGITDDTVAVQNLLDSSSITNFLFPIGKYKISSIQINKNNTIINGCGDSSAGTVFVGTIVNGNNITIENSQHCLIQNIYITSSVVKQSGFGLLVNKGYSTNITNVRVDYGYNGIGIQSSTESRIINCQLRYLFGDKGLYFVGSSQIGSYRAVVENLITNNPYIRDDGKVKIYSNSTNYNINDVVLVGNNIWQCTHAGTSSSNQNSFQIPDISPNLIFGDNGTPITNGSCKFNFISGQMSWIYQDSFAYSLVISKAALLNGYIGFRMGDSVRTADSYPKWAFTWDLETDHNFYCGVIQDAGEGLYINGGWVGSCLNGNGILVKGRGEFFVGGGTRIFGNAEHGILIDGGTNNKVSDCFIGANSQKNFGGFNGVTVGVNIQRFYILNNKIGTLCSGSNSQSSGIYINPECNNYIISNNDLLDNLNNSVLGIASSSKIIANNLPSSI